jgi:hypothetical protein
MNRPIVIQEHQWARAAIEGLKSDDVRVVHAALHVKTSDIFQVVKGGDRGSAYAYGSAGFFCLQQCISREKELEEIKQNRSVLFGSSIDPRVDSRFSQCHFNSVSKGDTLLHIACRNGSCIEVIEAIMSHPHAAQLREVQNEEGKLPKDLLEEVDFFQSELQKHMFDAPRVVKADLKAWAAKAMEVIT